MASGRPWLLYLGSASAVGLMLGGFVWLWTSQGTTVYFNYLAGAAFACL